jgi:hypothetical protein
MNDTERLDYISQNWHILFYILSAWKGSARTLRFIIDEAIAKDKRVHKHEFESDGGTCITCGKTVAQLIGNDYEPEQNWGSHHDISEHKRHGGTMEDY